MSELTIADVDDTVLARLRLKASLSGRTVEEVAREILQSAVGLSPAERVAEAERIRSLGPAGVGSDSWMLIRQSRDQR